MTSHASLLCQFIDRVLQLKFEQDALGEDIKQVYAEAHAARFDKTAMGKVVNHLRRHAKAGAKAQIADATFEEYLTAYEHGTVLATHAHAREADAPPAPWSRESEREFLASLDDGGIASTDPDLAPLPPHDDETGELIEEPAEVPSSTAAGQGELLGGSSVAPPISGAAVQVGSETAPVSGDVGESREQGAPEPPGCIAQQFRPRPDDFPELPSFLKRSAA